jgi:DNA-directed RNA polymerase subunit L
MQPKINHVKEEEGVLRFTLSGVNVSIANAVRRTILSDIPTVVFKTAPYEENRAIIHENTCRLNNEIIKQRLSCVPIHITDLDTPLADYVIEIHEENKSDVIQYVTTEHIRIQNRTTGAYLSRDDVVKYFPAHPQTGYYIDLVRLRPRISEDLPGEKLHLTCELSIDTAKTDGMFNCVSTASYGMTVDKERQQHALDKQRQEWKDKGMTAQEIEFETTNWKLLDGMRIVEKDSFDFVVESVGVYGNTEIVNKACEILVAKWKALRDHVAADEEEAIHIVQAETTLQNAFDVILEKEDYTMGKALEYGLYARYFEDAKTVTYCGFKKFHPHDTHGVVRLAFREPTDKTGVKQCLLAVMDELVGVYKKIKV